MEAVTVGRERIDVEDRERSVGLPEAARMLGVHEHTVRRYVKSGEIPSTFIAGRYRIKVDDIHDYIEGKERTPLAGADPQTIKMIGLKSQRRGFGFPDVITVDTDELARRFREAYNTAKMNRGAAAARATQTVLQLAQASKNDE